MKKYLEESPQFDFVIVETINSYIDDGEKLSELLLEYHPFNIMEAILKLEEDILRKFVKNVDIQIVANAFEYLEDEEMIEIFDFIDKEDKTNIINNMENEDVVDLIKELDDEEILDTLSHEKSLQLKKLLEFDDDQIGSFMSDTFFTLDKDMTVKEAMRKLTKEAYLYPFINTIFVVENKILVGYITLKNIILASGDELIGDVMNTRVISALCTDDKESVAYTMQDYGITSIPIIQEDGELLGIVTHDTLIDIIRNVNKEDYLQFASVPKDSRIDESVITSVKKRLPWLLVLLLLSICTTFLIQSFESTLAKSAALATQLAVYLPLILGMSGNSGTQSLAIMIRALTENDNNISKKMIRKHVMREFCVGLINGFVIMSLVFVLVLVTCLVTGDGVGHKEIMTAVMTSIAVFTALVVANISGVMIPYILNKFKVDPSVASGPFITTINDIISLVIYYGIGVLTLLPLYL